MAQSAIDFQPTGGPGGGEEAEGPGVIARTPRMIFWAKFKQDKLAIMGAILVLLMILLALSAGIVEKIRDIPYDFQFRDIGLNDFGSPSPPDATHWFGFDDSGRDLFIRVLYGARTSLKIAIIATGFELMIGVFVGMLAGYRRGWVDTLLSRLTDLILSIPFLLLAISLGVIYGGSETIVIFLITFFGWPYIARIVRGQTLVVA